MNGSLKSEYSDYCRICATESTDLKSLYHDIEHGKTFAEMINICARVSFNEFEIRPKCICTNCVANLKTAYEFYNLIICSEDKFKTLISSDLLPKSEVNTEDASDYKDISNSPEEYHFEPLIDAIDQSIIKTEGIFVEEPNVNLLSDENESDDQKVERWPRRRRGRPRNADKKPAVCKIRRPSIFRPSMEFECYQCHQSFPSLSKVKVHFREHDASTKCRICMKKFTRHDYIRHLCKGTEIPCQYCSKPFKTTASLIKHINGSHKDHRNYKCYKCAKAFPMKSLLEVHKPTHSQEEKRFICDICDSRFRTRFQIKEHMEITHTDKRSFLCATCGKSFKNPTYLRAHVKRHTPTKPVACPKCPKRFFDKHGLKKHIEVHDDAKFVCDICGSVMRSKASYNEHKRRHVKTKIYTCEVCSKQIKSSLYNLRLHMYTHTGEKPFKCTFCDRRYTQNADLNKHLRTHVGQNTYKCDLCDKSYRLLCDLRKHASEHYQQSLMDMKTDTTSNAVPNN